MKSKSGIPRLGAALPGIAIRLGLGWAAVSLSSAQNTSLADKFRAETEAEVATAYSVVFDTSGSMKGERLTQAKQAFRWWLGSVQPGNVWSVLCFEVGKGRVVVPFTPSGQGAVAAAIDRFEANGNTPIVATLALAEKQIAERKAIKPYERHVLLLFTDGDENQHPGRNGAVVEKVRQLRARSIEVIGVGYAGAGDYLNRVVSRYFSAGEEAGLKTGLSQVEVEVDPLTPVSVTPEEMKKLAGMPPEARAPAATNAPSEPARSEPAKVAPKKRADPPAPPPPARRASSGSGIGSVALIVGLASVALVIAIVKKLK
jgi:uncharacterized protein YegL